jgi:DNA-binding PadR family transcriptional regulator
MSNARSGKRTVSERFDPSPYLPLSPLAFQVLVVLADGERHGYAILREAAAQKAAAGPSASSLYAVIERLEDAGLIEESDQRPPTAVDVASRRYYRLTARGRAVGQAEAERLEALVDLTRRVPFIAPKNRP